MEDIYVCSPGEYVIINAGSGGKTSSYNGSICIVDGIKNGKIQCRRFASSGSSIVNADPSELLDSCEYHNDEEGDDNDDENDCLDSDSTCAGFDYLSESAINSHIKKYSLLVRVKKLLDTLKFNVGAFVENDSEGESAIQYLRRQLQTCQSKPLLVIGSYFLAKLLSVSKQYADAANVCCHLLYGHQDTPPSLSAHDRGVLLLLISHLYSLCGDEVKELDAIRQVAEIFPGNSYVAVKLLMLQKDFHNLNVLPNLEVLVHRDPHCVSAALALAQCYHSLGDSGGCRALLTRIGGEMRLIETFQSKSEAMEMHTETARLVIEYGVDLRVALVCLLRAVNVGRQVTPKALNDLSFVRCAVMFNAVSLLAETLERIGSNLIHSGQPPCSYNESAHSLYSICLESRSGEELNSKGSSDLNRIRSSRDRLSMKL